MKIQLILLTIGVQQLLSKGEVTIDSFPTPLNVILGNSFTLTCNYGLYTFHSWVHPTRGVLTQSTGHLTIEVYSDYSNMVVNSPTFDDQGEYVCRVRNDDALLTQTINASLFERVQITTQTILSYRAKLCETVTLRCNALYHETVVWSKNIDGFPRDLRNSSDGHITIFSDRLMVRETELSDNGTYTCVARNRITSDYITAILFIELHPSPENITLNIANKEPANSQLDNSSSVNLTFTWTPTASRSEENCMTNATCEVTELTTDGQLCRFIVQSLFDGSLSIASLASEPYTIRLKVPGAPLVATEPQYAFDLGNLTAVYTTIIMETNNNTSHDSNISSVTSYMIVYTDSISGQLCNLATISLSSCECGYCDHLFQVSSSSCPSTSVINITVFGTSSLGRGRPTEPTVIKSTNEYLEVVVYPLINTVYCNSVTLENEIMTCSILYGFAEMLTECQVSLSNAEENTASESSTSINNFTLLLSELHQQLLQNNEFCFLIKATFNQNLTVAVKGNFNLKNIDTTNAIELSSLSTDTERIIDSQGIAVIITTLCITLIILILIVLLVIIIVTLKKRRSKSLTKQRTSNIYELTESEGSPKEQDEHDQGLIYADIATCSTQINMILDDDQVEYAVIERNVDGEPLTKVARGTETRKTTSQSPEEPLNLDSLLIKIQSQVTPKWYQFGVAIGIEQSVLDRYLDYPDDVCIVEILDNWLRRRHKKPKWKDVGEALKEIGLHQLGDEILRVRDDEKGELSDERGKSTK